MRSRNITVTIDLSRIRSSAAEIRTRTGVPLIAVVKADAYGLGAARVAKALDAVADEFAYFTIHEARDVGRPGLVMGPPEGEPGDYREAGLRPAITTREDAERYRGIPAAVNVDTGMQRLGAKPEMLDELLAISGAVEVFTHACEPAAVERFMALTANRPLRRHAAATALLDHPQAWLEAVRPGLALFRGAVRVSVPLVVVRETSGGVGYGGFECPRIGVFLGGYSNHVGPAPVLINGRPQRIIESGMNTSIVSVHQSDRPGDQVVLLGDGLTESVLAGELGVRPHEILCRYTAMGRREYSPRG